ncbi:MAG: hypothetical protein ACR2NH_12370, partial [Solirubrobacteraceae bacterium]
ARAVASPTPAAVPPPEAAPQPRRMEPEAVAAASPAAVAVAVAEPAGEPPAADPDPAPVPDPAPAPDPAPVPLTPAGEPDLDAIRSLWPGVIETVRTQNAMLAALLEGANPVGVVGGELRLAFAESAAFFKRKAEDVANREIVGQALQAVTGSPLKLIYDLRADGEQPEPAGAVATPLSGEELIDRVMAEFDAEELPNEADQPPGDRPPDDDDDKDPA